MTVLRARKRRRMAVTLYGVAAFFLVAGVVVSLLSSDIVAIAYGLVPSIGIALGATAIILRKSK
jgi:hypothetical protein